MKIDALEIVIAERVLNGEHNGKPCTTSLGEGAIAPPEKLEQNRTYASLHHRHSETALDPTHFRMYSSGEYRWFTPDPLQAGIFTLQASSSYAYTQGNGTNFTDPTGLDSVKVTLRGRANDAGATQGLKAVWLVHRHGSPHWLWTPSRHDCRISKISPEVLLQGISPSGVSLILPTTLCPRQ